MADRHGEEKEKCHESQFAIMVRHETQHVSPSKPECGDQRVSSETMKHSPRERAASPSFVKEVGQTRPKQEGWFDRLSGHRMINQASSAGVIGLLSGAMAGRSKSKQD